MVSLSGVSRKNLTDLSFCKLWKSSLWLFTSSVIAYMENLKEFTHQNKTPLPNLSYELGKAHNARPIYKTALSIPNDIKYTKLHQLY